MGEGQKAAMGVARQAAAEVEGAGGGGRSGLALLEEADRFELNDEGDGEGVVDPGDVDVGRRETGSPAGPGGGLLAPERVPPAPGYAWHAGGVLSGPKPQPRP